VLLLAAQIKYRAEIGRVLVLQEDNIRRMYEVDRLEEWDTWWNELSQNPAVFGRGMMTYGNRGEVEVYPHNGLLHVLNGYGLIAGAVYIWAFLGFGRALLRSENLRPVVVRWSIGFFLAMSLHSIFECEVLGSDSVHLMSLFLAYAVALGLWGGAPPELQRRDRHRRLGQSRRSHPRNKGIPAAVPG
jgi:hypothetical protein